MVSCLFKDVNRYLIYLNILRASKYVYMNYYKTLVYKLGGRLTTPSDVC